MRIVTRSLIFLLVGAVLGDLITMFIAPAIITWYNSSADPSALCNCLTTARNTSSLLLKSQAIGTGAGAFLSLVLGLMIARARRKHVVAQQKPAAPASST